MQLKPMGRCRIHLFTDGLCEADHAITGVKRVGDLDELLAGLFAGEASPRVAVIPEGPYLVPRIG